MVCTICNTGAFPGNGQKPGPGHMKWAKSRSKYRFPNPLKSITQIQTLTHGNEKMPLKMLKMALIPPKMDKNVSVQLQVFSLEIVQNQAHAWNAG